MKISRTLQSEFGVCEQMNRIPFKCYANLRISNLFKLQLNSYGNWRVIGIESNRIQNLNSFQPLYVRV